MLFLGLSGPEYCCYIRPIHPHIGTDWQGEFHVCTLPGALPSQGALCRFKIQSVIGFWLMRRKRESAHTCYPAIDCGIHSVARHHKRPSKLCICSKLVASSIICLHDLISLLLWIPSLVPSVLFSWTCIPKGLIFESLPQSLCSRKETRLALYYNSLSK